MTIINRGTGLFAAVLVTTLLLTGSTTHAAGGDTGSEPATDPGQVSSATTDQPTKGYSYTVGVGESLSVITRDAIQRYASSTETELSAAQRVYCETTLTQQLGGRLLEIGENIVVPFSQLEQCTETSKSLTPQQTDAWQQYAAQTDLNIEGGPEPTNPQENLDITETDETSEETDESASDENESTSSDEEEAGADIDDEAIAWYWWVLALSIVGVVFYLLRDKPVEETEATAPPAKTDKVSKKTKSAKRKK